LIKLRSIKVDTLLGISQALTFGCGEMIAKYVRHLAVVLVALVSLPLLAAGIQKWVDKDGNVYYGDRPPQVRMSRQIQAASQSENHYDVLRELLLLARHGDANAQLRIADTFTFGFDGVPQDFEKAAKWYHRAALQNHAVAQYNLADSHENGLGVPQSNAQAYMWYSVSIENGIGPVGDRAIDRISKSMTPVQISQGQMLAKEWLEKHPPTPPPDLGCIR
jgi:hypothetical protein